MMPDLSLEEFYYQQHQIIAGVDEAGRGPWAGPVVAAAVIYNRSHPIAQVNDSKKLSNKLRESLFEEITAKHTYGIGMASVAEIDQFNILAATKLAMLRALEALPITPYAALIDGNQPPHHATIQMQSVIGGDSKSLSIAAASIVAKVTRDRLMTSLSLKHPHFGWEKNAGYGTKAHQDALANHGITPHHRKSFAPIKRLLAETA